MTAETNNNAENSIFNRVHAIINLKKESITWKLEYIYKSYSTERRQADKHKSKIFFNYAECVKKHMGQMNGDPPNKIKSFNAEIGDVRRSS